MRIKGHNDPLVWSGRSRRLASIRKVRATSRGARVILNAPALNRMKRQKELTRVIPREMLVLSRRLDRFINRRLKPV